MKHSNKLFSKFINEARTAREIEAWAAKRYINKPTIVVTPHGASFIGSPPRSDSRGSSRQGNRKERQVTKRTHLKQNASYNDLQNVRLGRIRSGGRGRPEEKVRIGALATLPREISTGRKAQRNLVKMGISPSSTADATKEFPTSDGRPHTEAGKKEAVSLYGVKKMLKRGYSPSNAENYEELGAGQFTVQRGKRGADVSLKDPKKRSLDVPQIEVKYRTASPRQPNPRLSTSLDNATDSTNILTTLIRSLGRNWKDSDGKTVVGLKGLLSGKPEIRKSNLDRLDAMKAERDRERKEKLMKAQKAKRKRQKGKKV